jgi:hydrogenase maturation protease
MQTVIGIGSHHGADAIGWRVVERLQTKSLLNAKMVLAREPSDILRVCETAKILHIVDGCIGPSPGRLHQIAWPDSRLDPLRWTSTHGFDVPGTLALAAALDIVPSSVILWCIECDDCVDDPCGLDPGIWGSLKPAIESAAATIFSKIAMVDDRNG